MRFFADLHVHSKHSRATSRDMSPESIWRWAQLKGVSVIGTGDATHPAWIAELREKLEPEGNGLFRLRKRFQTGDVPMSCRSDVRFILTAEISCIYSKHGRTRKVHSLVLLPDLRSADRLNKALSEIGNLKSDGRPILGLDAKQLLRMTLDASSGSMLIPAHVWTPHFSVLGAASGFDSLEECYEDLTPHIHAVETGLSSDPAMNWRLSQLDGITLVSNSDAHSAANIGREANIFDTNLSYPAMLDAIRTRQGFLGTVEFFPEEGKYHYDGHRTCGVRLSPKETKLLGGRCPVCGKALTIGVMHRVEELADRDEGARPEGAPGYSSIIPLADLIGGALDVGSGSKKVERACSALLAELGNEFTVLQDVPFEDIRRASSPVIANAVERMRDGRVTIEPGYDGEYGTVRIEAERKLSEDKRERPIGCTRGPMSSDSAGPMLFSRE